jgi:pyruvate dehydrogenase E1 component
VAATVPNCRAYDPAFACELAVILDHGMRQMVERQVDEFYYVTVMNESYAQPSLPDGAREGIVRGMYRLQAHGRGTPQVRLLGSGTILREVMAAAQMLESEWNVASEVFSVTSFAELAREAREVERWNRLHPLEPARRSHVETLLAADAPIVAATDYVRAYPQLVASYVRAPFTALGTDGFGRSDTRASLRRFFEVSREHVVVAALATLSRERAADAIARYGIDVASEASWLR